LFPTFYDTYEKSILGCGLNSELKGLGGLCETFEGGFFNFLRAKNFFVENIVATALKSCIEKSFLFFFLGNFFHRLKI
jgi:hypothetical protein